MSFTRRQFLQTAAAVAACGVPSLRAQEAAEKLPPVRAITRGPAKHWFGYYDKLQFDPTSRYVLGMQVDFEHRSPRPEDVIEIGLVDLQGGDKWTRLGESRAWGWQQGCMLQWVPGSKSEVLWNDREGDHFVCRVHDVFTHKQRVLSNPIYALSPTANKAIATDFARLNDVRPGYGYAGLPDPHRDQLTPKTTGIFQVDLTTGRQQLLLSVEQVAQFGPQLASMKGAKHWFNHLLYSPDGARFIFLHRWRPVNKAGFETRMLTAKHDGSDLYVLDPSGATSHFIWRDNSHILAWTQPLGQKPGFYLFTDQTNEVTQIGKDVMTVNGHCTYLPGNEWILNDTYPDAQRLQHPYVYHVPTGRRLPLGHFRSPPPYTGEWRCDTHPRFSPDGRWVCIDSPHDSTGRQMYLIDLRNVT